MLLLLNPYGCRLGSYRCCGKKAIIGPCRHANARTAPSQNQIQKRPRDGRGIRHVYSVADGTREHTVAGSVADPTDDARGPLFVHCRTVHVKVAGHMRDAWAPAPPPAARHMALGRSVAAPRREARGPPRRSAFAAGKRDPRGPHTFGARTAAPARQPAHHVAGASRLPGANAL